MDDAQVDLFAEYKPEPVYDVLVSVLVASGEVTTSAELHLSVVDAIELIERSRHQRSGCRVFRLDNGVRKLVYSHVYDEKEKSSVAHLRKSDPLCERLQHRIMESYSKEK